MPVANIFNEMDVKTDPFAVCQLQGKCELAVGRLAGAALHYVLAGEGEIVFKNRPAVFLRPGSLVLIPAFEFHILRGHGVNNGQIPELKYIYINYLHSICEAA